MRDQRYPRHDRTLVRLLDDVAAGDRVRFDEDPARSGRRSWSKDQSRAPPRRHAAAATEAFVSSSRIWAVGRVRPYRGTPCGEPSPFCFFPGVACPAILLPLTAVHAARLLLISSRFSKPKSVSRRCSIGRCAAANFLRRRSFAAQVSVGSADGNIKPRSAAAVTSGN
jgi:hypothetical protein